ncbi:MAG: FAD-dependent oxidoreductase [Snowella sp.]|nr:MAG: FAD-dependent oxidoreductase [Snowella sp.]
MKTYDWIVVGAGITGAALAYELAKQGLHVLLLEKEKNPHSATYYSYGGVAYWSGSTPLTRQLCQESKHILGNLSQELDGETEYRELNLVLTIPQDRDPETIRQNYANCLNPPDYLTVEKAIELEPLLNCNEIAGVLTVAHGHIHAQKTTRAYLQAFLRLGGTIAIEPVLNLLRQNERIIGVITAKNTYQSENTVICAGAFSRSFLETNNISIPLYFSHAQVIKTPPLNIRLRSLVMPAVLQRLEIEAQARQPEKESDGTLPNSNVMAAITEPGAIQFLDGNFYLGQVSQIITDASMIPDLTQSETEIRSQIAKILPQLANVPGTCHHCLVAFSDPSRPLVGKIENLGGIHLFSGFTSPLAYAPPLARHFATWATQGNDQVIDQFSAIG